MYLDDLNFVDCATQLQNYYSTLLKQIYAIEKSRAQFNNVSMKLFPDETADSEAFNRKE